MPNVPKMPNAPNSQMTTREAIERLHADERLRSNLTDTQARKILTLAEHWLIELANVNRLDEVTYAKVVELAESVNVANTSGE